jgi:carbon starvation protein
VSVAFVFGGALAVFAIAFWTYGRLLTKLFRLGDARNTPAHALEDGEDYVPTRRGYLLAQHFSAISAAGPIVGPIVAGREFGWLPALLWIVGGAVFIGAMHDFSALVGSVRHGARSVPEIMREHMSPFARYLFLLFIWLALVYVIIAFTDVTARQFVGAVELDDGSKVEGGGIATASLLYLVVGVAMGIALRKKMPLWLATAIFVPLVAAAIWFGQKAPISLPFAASTEDAVRGWDYVLLAYCGIASIVPMWALLQPRGYLGGFFLYAVLAAAVIGIFAGGQTTVYPAFLGWESGIGPLFPFLFITIACGACSGFHGLVCSGTTSKQLDRERDAHAVGYGGMLLEGAVAVISLVCVMLLAQGSAGAKLEPSRIYALGIGGFVQKLGIDPTFAVAFASLAFATFVYDTLDVATRLGRYVIQELTGRKSRVAAVGATLATLLLPALFVSVEMYDAAGRRVPAWKVFWTIFGASNQLLAALTLLGLTVWLKKLGRTTAAWITGVPMVFMMVMTVWSLGAIVATAARKYSATSQLDSPAIVALVLLVLAALLIIEAARAVFRPPPAIASRGAASPG